MPTRQSATAGEVIVIVAGATTLVASVLPFAADRNAWSDPWFPLATLVPLYGTLMALQVALTRFAGVRLPRTVFGFTWEQLLFAAGLMAGAMAIAWMSTAVLFKQIGFWLEILGGVGLGVGSYTLHHERDLGGWT